MTRPRLIPAFLAVFLAACSTGPDYVRPALDVPAGFRYATTPATVPALPLRWWEQFNDPVLTAAIESALEHNLDLRIATTRLLEYQAIRTVAGAPLLPQVSVSVNETRTSQGTTPIADVFQGGFNLAWELDFWGRIRRLSEAAQADLLGQEQARQAVLLTLVSSVATSYIQLREFDARLEIARRTRDSRQEALRLATRRYEVGTVSELEFKQASAEYQGTVLSVQQLEQAVAQKENELSLLLGRNPGAIQRGRSLAALTAPAVPGGLPSELLARRPDIAQAEQALVAANARVGAARASLFPTISLTATLGGASTQLSQLFSGANRMWSFVPAVNLPIFDAGNLAAQVAISEARREQALDGYRKAVQGAFRDTEDALVGVTKSGEQKATQAKLVDEVRRYAHLAKLRYENGITSNLEVLDSQRSLFNAEQTLAQAQSAALVATVNLYKALGGDWGVDGRPTAGGKFPN
ncbi:MAG: efflux transporter outer membrane subunit [Sulfuricella sp.]|nr:efflux transporter outer membrane subunit [Sulfuricella sp.]